MQLPWKELGKRSRARLQSINEAERKNWFATNFTLFNLGLVVLLKYLLEICLVTELEQVFIVYPLHLLLESFILIHVGWPTKQVHQLDDLLLPDHNTIMKILSLRLQLNFLNFNRIINCFGVININLPDALQGLESLLVSIEFRSFLLDFCFQVRLV